MPFIIEQFIKGKIDEEKCEDALVITDDFVAVIDGVSSKSAWRQNGMSTGKVASLLVAEAVRSLKREASLPEFLNEVSERFSVFYETANFTENREMLGPQAMAAIVSEARQELWLIGDCRALAGGKFYTSLKKSDVVLEAFRSLAAHIGMAEEGVGPDRYFADGDRAREVILPWIKRATIFMNRAETEWGYPALNGGTVPPELIKVIPLEREEEIVLATDGYPELRPTLAESEAVLERLLREDPYCIGAMKSTKGLAPGQTGFDDRAYVRFRLDEKA